MMGRPSDTTERTPVEQLKDELLAAVSHELRTPLTSIQGYVDLLAEEEDLSPEVRRDAFAAIERNVARLRRLVDDAEALAQR